MYVFFYLGCTALASYRRGHLTVKRDRWQALSSSNYGAFLLVCTAECMCKNLTTASCLYKKRGVKCGPLMYF